MKAQKTWSEIHFIEGEVEIEATINYKTKQFSLTHANNDENVTYNSDGKKAVEDMKAAMIRNKCVAEALKYIKKELEL